MNVPKTKDAACEAFEETLGAISYLAGPVYADEVRARVSSLEAELEKTRVGNCELYVENTELKQNAIHAQIWLDEMQASLCHVRSFIKRRAFSRAEQEIDTALKTYRDKGDTE